MKKNDILDKVAVRQFLALLRAGLWGASCETEYFENDDRPDWKGILYLARTQAVLPLVYDGMLTLPERMRLNGPALLKLIAYVDRIEGLNQALDEAAAEISSRLEAEGIRSVLLKGQGLATLYRIPGHRQCGDIDLYVGEKNYRKAADIIRTWKEVHGEMTETTKHTGFMFGELELELHKTAMELPYKKMNASYRQWENESLGSLSTEIILGEKNSLAVKIPPATFNLFYVFYHAFNHFMQCGLGLRQLCDIARMLHEYSHELNLDELKKRLEEFKLDREWQLFLCLAVDFLGLKDEEAPLYNPELKPLSEKLLDTILRDGNFGQYKSLPNFSGKPKFIRQFGSMVTHHILFAQRYKFSPRQTVIQYWVMWRNGLFNASK